MMGLYKQFDTLYDAEPTLPAPKVRTPVALCAAAGKWMSDALTVALSDTLVCPCPSQYKVGSPHLLQYLQHESPKPPKKERMLPLSPQSMKGWLGHRRDLKGPLHSRGRKLERPILLPL